MPIHTTAVINKGAEIDSSADIGPYCVIGPNAKIGAETRLLSHVVVDNHTTIGARNVIHSFATVGGVPHPSGQQGVNEERLNREISRSDEGVAVVQEGMHSGGIDIAAQRSGGRANRARDFSAASQSPSIGRRPPWVYRADTSYRVTRP